MVAVSAKKPGRIRSWWGKQPPCIRTWIKVVVLPIVSALLALTVFGYWTYIQRGEWTPDHQLGVLAYLFAGVGSLFGKIMSLIVDLAAGK